MNSFLDPAALSDFYASPTIPVMTTPDLSYDLLGGDLSSLAALTPSIPSTPPMTDATPSHEEYIMYYFNHVRPLQFVFAGNTVTNLLYSVRAVDRSFLHVNELTPISIVYRCYMRNQEEHSPMHYVPSQAYTLLVYASPRASTARIRYPNARYPSTTTTLPTSNS